MMSARVHLRKYGESTTIDFDLYQPDGVDLEPAASFASGDVKLMKNEGTEANTTNLPSDEGQGYSLVLTATEMQAARLVIYVVDQTATKVWLDKVIIIETYGNASAQHAFDLDDADVNVGSTSSGAITSSSFASGAITSTVLAASCIGSSQIASGAIGSTEFQSGAITSTVLAANCIGSSQLGADCITSSELATTAVQEIRDAITGGAYALDTDSNGRMRIVDGTGTGEINTSFGAIVTVQNVTNEVDANLTSWDGGGFSGLDQLNTDYDDLNGLYVYGFRSLALAAIQGEAEDALQTYNLDHWMGAACTGANVVDNSALAQLVSASVTADWDDFANTTDSLQAIRDQGDAAWITATGFSTHSAADVWTSGTRSLTDKAGFTISGTLTTLDALDTQQDSQHSTTQANIAALNDLDAAGVWAHGTRSLTDKAGFTINGTLTTLDALDTAQDTQHSTTQSNIAALNDISTSDVLTQANQAIVDNHLDHLLAVDTGASLPGATGSIFHDLLVDDAGTWQFSTNALANAPSGGGGGGDATEAKQDTIISHLTDMKGAGWTSTDTLENIYNDTNELQANQGNWLTATGFSTHSADDVWLSATRTLSAGTNLNDISAADVWAAATRSLTDKAGFTINGTLTTLDALDSAQDTQHGVTQAAVGALNDITAADVWAAATRSLTEAPPAGTLTSAERDAIATAMLDLASGVEGGAANVTVRKALRALLAAMVGKVSGAETNSPAFRDPNDTVDRISASTDANGNRTSVTLNLG